jgi:hypothetical protein
MLHDCPREFYRYSISQLLIPLVPRSGEELSHLDGAEINEIVLTPMYRREDLVVRGWSGA